MTQLEILLIQIEASVAIAREALADEHEANLRRAISFLELDAREAADLVRSW
jgi:hypothetical protein